MNRSKPKTKRSSPKTQPGSSFLLPKMVATSTSKGNSLHIDDDDLFYEFIMSQVDSKGVVTTSPIPNAVTGGFTTGGFITRALITGGSTTRRTHYPVDSSPG